MVARVPTGSSPGATCTGSSPATRFVAPFSPASARKRAISPTSIKSKPRSTRSPTISSAVSMFRRCWPLHGHLPSDEQREMQREPRAQQQAAFDQASEAVDLQCAYDIGASRAGAAVAEPRIGDEPFRVAAWARQRHAERPRHRALRPARIRRMMLAPVAQHDRQRMARSAVLREHCRGGEEEPAGESWNCIETVVEACRRPSKAAVAGGAVADHAVERVCHFVCKEPRQAEQEVPKDRSNDAVTEIFREAFDRGASDAVLVEARRIAPDDMAYRLTAAGQSAGLKRGSHGGDVFIQTALRDEHADQHRFERSSDETTAADPLDDQADQRDTADQHDNRDNAAL